MKADGKIRNRQLTGINLHALKVEKDRRGRIIPVVVMETRCKNSEAWYGKVGTNSKGDGCDWR